MKIDPYKHKEKFLAWKEKIKKEGCIKGISQENFDLIVNYVFDMEIGRNVSAKVAKGTRSYSRLNSLKQGMVFFSKMFKKHYGLQDLTNLTEDLVIEFFAKIRNGDIRRIDGGVYKSAADMINIFKAFWHWHQKVNRKNGVEVRDITVDLDTSTEKPKWVYLNEEQIKKLCDGAKHKYKVLIMFLYDSGIRSPTELVNIKVSDLSPDCKELNIRDEISKTFGRRIKLMFSADLVRRYIKEKGFEKEDMLFSICPKVVNKYFKRLAHKLFGDEVSEAGEKYSNLTMYDFRHCSCCYWLPRYKSESALKYRFGWKKSDKIHYYSELLGMKDTISEEDMLIDVTKTELENRLKMVENERDLQNERLKMVEKQNREIIFYLKRLKTDFPQEIIQKIEITKLI